MLSTLLMPDACSIGPVGAGKVVGGGPSNIIHSKQGSEDLRIKRKIEMFLKLNLSL